MKVAPGALRRANASIAGEKSMPKTLQPRLNTLPKRSLGHNGVVTLPTREREVAASQDLSGRCDRGAPRVHRRGAKRAVRLGGDEMALDVEGVVGYRLEGRKILASGAGHIERPIVTASDHGGGRFKGAIRDFAGMPPRGSRIEAQERAR